MKTCVFLLQKKKLKYLASGNEIAGRDVSSFPFSWLREKEIH